MADPLQLKHDEQPSFKQLRDEFRQANKERILDKLVKAELEVGPLKYHYWFDEDQQPIDVWLSEDGQAIFNGMQDFGLELVDRRLVNKLDNLVEKVNLDLAAHLPEDMGFEHDGPPLSSLTDEQTLLDYTANLIKESHDPEETK